MQLWRLILILIAIITLGGCGDNGTQQPYIMGQNPANTHASSQRSEKIETAKIDGQTRTRIAIINKARDIEVQKLKSDADVKKADINKAVAIEEVQVQKTAIANAHDYSTNLLTLIGFTCLMLLLFLFYNTSKNRKERLKKHEDELLFKLRLQEQEMKMKMAEKMLDSIASGKLSPEQEHRMLKTVEHTSSQRIGKNR